jgi:hypothetical protein
VTPRLVVVALTTTVVAVACGGRVEGGSTGFSSSGPSPTASAPGRRPPSGGHPTRPPIGPLSSASVASQIAETYCKTFSSCCVAKGEPPIDVARCRELTGKELEQKLDSTGFGAAAAEDVLGCVEAIRNRMAACSNEDAKWWERESPALFAPTSVRMACEALVGPASTGGAPCSPKLPCAAGSTCAIDECVRDNVVGASCASEPQCLDGASCTGGVCAVVPGGAVNAACTTDATCQLGLVCASGKCAPAREHPENPYEPRSSPYRIGADTCGVFTYL